MKKTEFKKKYLKNILSLGRNDGLYSQSYQDQLINSLINDFDVSKFCVEIGFNASELLEGSGSNCANLILNHSWESLLLDAHYENDRINLKKVLLTSENIVPTLSKFGVPIKPGYISIDIDSIDLFLFKNCAEKYKPFLYSVEYNSNFPFGVQATRGPVWEPWQNNKAFGASLSALVTVAESVGYSLLWVVEPFDAFFIRKDVFERDPGKYVFNLRYYKNKTLIDVHKPISYESPHNFIDYKVFSKTNSIQLASESFDRKYLKYLQKDSKSTFRFKVKSLERLLKSYLKNLIRSR